nr:hypothetical protein [Flavobacterium sp. '19STA2R22 D10 B1']
MKQISVLSQQLFLDELCVQAHLPGVENSPTIEENVSPQRGSDTVKPMAGIMYKNTKNVMNNFFITEIKGKAI